MENATKALLIAAGVLIGIMILSLAVSLYSELNAYVQSSQEAIEFNEQNAFNTQFTKYINYIGGEKQFELTIQDVVTAANLAHECNINYNIIEEEEINEARGNDSSLYIEILLDGQPIEHTIDENSVNLLNNNLGRTYKCESIHYSEKTGRVNQISFHSL